jgi:hypothetical protein
MASSRSGRESEGERGTVELRDCPRSPENALFPRGFLGQKRAYGTASKRGPESVIFGIFRTAASVIWGNFAQKIEQTKVAESIVQHGKSCSRGRCRISAVLDGCGFLIDSFLWKSR